MDKTKKAGAVVHLRVPAKQKAKWVRSSRASGLRLTDWLLQRIEMNNFDGFTLNIPTLRPFEAYFLALSDDDSRVLFKSVKALDAEQKDATVAVKEAGSYLEKRVAMADGKAYQHLFHDINSWAIDYFALYPKLTHWDLIEVLAHCEAL